MAIDIVSDLTKLFRLGSKVASGEMSIGDVLTGEGEEEAPEEAPRKTRPACKMTPGCTEGLNHRGGCCIDATVDDDAYPGRSGSRAPKDK